MRDHLSAALDYEREAAAEPSEFRGRAGGRRMTPDLWIHYNRRSARLRRLASIDRIAAIVGKALFVAMALMVAWRLVEAVIYYGVV